MDESPGSIAAAAHLEPSDEQLMALIQAKQPQALEQLFDRHSKMIKSLVFRILHNEAESDDMLQEIFLEIWNRSGGYAAEKGRPLGWLITLTRRRSIDRLRKKESYSRMNERLTKEVETSAQNWATHVEEDSAHNEMREQLNRVLAALPVAQRQAIELAYFKGMSQREIAAHTGIPLGTIKTRLELALRKLAAALSGFEDLL